MDKKQEAIELLKKETTNVETVYKENGGFVFSGTYNSKQEEKISVGDYFIARKPKNTIKRPAWNNDMDKYDGVIQKCEEISFLGDITVSGVEWVFDPDWCEKVSPGDVMKTEHGHLFIFKGIDNNYIYDYAFYEIYARELFINNNWGTAHKDAKVFHVSPEESRPLFDALANAGKKWNAEKKRVEDMVWEAKDGDVCTSKDGIIFIYKTKTTSTIHFYAALYGGHFFTNHKFIGSSLRIATYEERCKFFERLVKDGYKWDAKKLKLTKVEKKHTEEKWPKNIDICISTLTSGTTLSHMAELCDKPTVDERKILNQMIKLCKQLLNEKK